VRWVDGRVQKSPLSLQWWERGGVQVAFLEKTCSNIKNIIDTEEPFPASKI
jgi:hypothetical protein